MSHITVKTYTPQSLFTLWFFSLLISFATITQAAPAPIGHVLFITGGQAYVQRHHQKLPLQPKAPLYPGDQLITPAHTYLHLHMIDEARLSLRPNSQLRIQCYQTQTSTPCLKLKLQQGQLHIIDGKVAQQHSQQFRLNTPIAAIGVKGTEFIVQAQSQQTQVQVLQGAIVAAPFGQGCQPEALGICQTPYATLLTQQDPFILQIQPHQKPQKIPLDQHQLALKKQWQHHSAPPLTMAQVLADNPELVQQYIQQAESLKQQDNSSQSQSQPLLYSYWSNDSDELNYPISQVPQGYQVTVGDNQTVLWRAPGLYQPPTGQLHYHLQQAQGVLNQRSQFQPVSVTEGQLTLNFDLRQFTTQLTVNLPNGAQTYQINQHMLRDDGIFALTNAQGAKFVGGIANDGQSVGYILNHQRPEGLLKVQTLWQAQRP